jgi:hypothetical protein
VGFTVLRLEAEPTVHNAIRSLTETELRKDHMTRQFGQLVQRKEPYNGRCGYGLWQGPKYCFRGRDPMTWRTRLKVQHIMTFVEAFSSLLCWMRFCTLTTARDVVDLLSLVFCFAPHRILDSIQHMVLTCYQMCIACSACVCKGCAACW